ncbi:receptor-type tyrosine-protein phosphatase T-like isoform X4 [Aquarana catesbeiana]|uniref:receptor-type tyrosine-protein phosphatase T-like isoform X4 n=1 Tax=Aquarana catesbeiana TaxID=8400 RepID=UPI003CCA0B0B
MSALWSYLLITVCLLHELTANDSNPQVGEAQCKKPTIDNVYSLSIDKEYYKKGEEVRVWCISGYYPSSDTMKCNKPHNSQEWTPSTVTCIAQCSPPIIPNMEYISVDKEYYNKNEEIIVRCQSGYYPSSDTITCDNPRSSQEWTPSVTCIVPGQIEIKKVPSMEDNTIRWSLSEKWGNITGFQMNISAWRDYNVLFAVDESLQFPPNVTEYKIPLQYGTNYTITLQGFTSGGPGEVTTQNIETDIGDPPLHMEETISDVTLQLQPVLSLNGPIRSYEIIVFGGHEGNSTKECLNFKNTPYNSSWTISRYTAAVLHAETLIGPRTFTLGDNHHYNGFHNAPLIPNHNYTIYIRVTSHWNHVDKSSCAFVGFLQIPPESASSITPIIAGSIAAVCLLLILLFLVILWRSRSSRDVIIALFLKKQAVAP